VRGLSATAALVVALAVLGVAAAVDVFRDDRPEPSPRVPSPPPSPEAATARSLARAGLEGVLFYTETSSCRLRAFRLPEVSAARAPEWERCTVSVSPDGRHAAEDRAAWRRDSQLQALEIAGGVDVVATEANWARRFPGARDPAFKPNGALTFVRRGQLIEWTTACPPGVRSLTFREPRPTRRCARRIRTEAELTAAAPAVPRPPLRRFALIDVAWLDNRRFAALLDAGADAALVAVGPRGVSAPWTIRQDLARLETSPRLGYVSLAWGLDMLVFRRSGQAVEVPEGVRALAWSPDDAWLAVAYSDSLEFHSLRDPALRLPQIPIAARDLEWR
jgi:hypothetical protein